MSWQVAFALLWLVGCSTLRGPIDAPPPTPGSFGTDAGPTAVSSCPSEKIGFAQREGCQNDGSNEFCLPRDRPDLLMEVAKRSPKTVCQPGGGRAGCRMGDRLLCMIPTEPVDCVAGSREMTPLAWETLCMIAGLPEVTEIVHTFYE